MQYQVYKKDTREVVAWIDTENNDVVLHTDYDVIKGKDLKVKEALELSDDGKSYKLFI